MEKMIAPSILSADFSCLKEEIKRLENAGADIIHIDVMDGHFVPNITMGPMIVKAIRKVTSLPLDVHLMIENPVRYIEDFVSAGADWISVHVEGERHLERVLTKIRSHNRKAGVVLNPATPLNGLEYVIHTLDFILIMTVNPGFGGQSLIPSVLEKVRILKEKFDLERLEIPVEVDGGINLNTIREVAKSGADIFVAGSGILGQNNYKDVISEMRRIINEVQ